MALQTRGGAPPQSSVAEAPNGRSQVHATPPSEPSAHTVSWWAPGWPLGLARIITGWLWATPERALSDPEITLVYATRSVLETIATGESATQLFKRARSERDVPIIEPRMIETESGWVVTR